MKKIIIIIILVTGTMSAYSQSKSYEALHTRFKGEKDVFAFSMSGFICRIAVKMMKSQNEVLGAMTKDIRHIRFIVIPQQAFRDQHLSLTGFKGYLKKDAFDEMATIRDNGEIVSVYHRTDENAKDRYFVIVEDGREIVAIEMKGTIDPAFFQGEDKRISINK